MGNNNPNRIDPEWYSPDPDESIHGEDNLTVTLYEYNPKTKKESEVYANVTLIVYADFYFEIETENGNQITSAKDWFIEAVMNEVYEERFKGNERKIKDMFPSIKITR